MNIEIVGPESVGLRTLEHHVNEALRVLRLEASLRTYDSPAKLAEFDVVFTPALIIDGHVAWQGGIPAFETIVKAIIEETQHPVV